MGRRLTSPSTLPSKMRAATLILALASLLPQGGRGEMISAPPPEVRGRLAAATAQTQAVGLPPAVGPVTSVGSTWHPQAALHESLLSGWQTEAARLLSALPGWQAEAAQMLSALTGWQAAANPFAAAISLWETDAQWQAAAVVPMLASAVGATFSGADMLKMTLSVDASLLRPYSPVWIAIQASRESPEAMARARTLIERANARLRLQQPEEAP